MERPVASPEAVRYVEGLRRHVGRMTAVATLNLHDQRIVAEGMHAMTGTPEGVRWRDAADDAVPGIWSELDDSLVSAPDAVILYLHGGGYMCGTPVGYRHLVGHVARAAGVKALTPVYGLAPERAYPAGLEDA